MCTKYLGVVFELAGFLLGAHEIEMSRPCTLSVSLVAQSFVEVICPFTSFMRAAWFVIAMNVLSISLCRNSC